MHEQVTQYEFLEELKELVRVSFESVYFILAILNLIFYPSLYMFSFSITLNLLSAPTA